MGGVQFAFLTLPLHLQRELCIVMLGTGCKFFRIFIVGADARGYMYLLCPHILQPVCLVSYPPTRLPTYRYTTLFPSIHLTTYPSTYLPTHTHTHTHTQTHTLSYKPRFGHLIVAHINCLSCQFLIQVTAPRKQLSEHKVGHSPFTGVQVKNKEDLRFIPQGVVFRHRDKFTSVLVCSPIFALGARCYCH